MNKSFQNTLVTLLVVLQNQLCIYVYYLKFRLENLNEHNVSQLYGNCVPCFTYSLSANSGVRQAPALLSEAKARDPKTTTQYH